MKDFLQKIFHFLKDLYNKFIKFLKSISPEEEKPIEEEKPAEDEKTV
tara:strand:+ start:195 stop:335 length:141 start_codon:yes stop_codon:yes gene_type:complete